MSTTYHIHIPVDSLLGMSDKELMETVNHPDGSEGARSELHEMQKEGISCLVVGDCDNKKPDGSCAGHPSNNTQQEEING